MHEDKILLPFLVTLFASTVEKSIDQYDIV